MQLLEIAISGCYFIIAYQFWAARKAVKRRRAYNALLALMLVFVFCGISGYLGVALGFPHIVMMVTHFALLCFSVVFIITNQPAVILSAFYDR